MIDVGNADVYMNVLDVLIHKSIRLFLPDAYPPKLPNPLLRLLTYKSIFFSTLKKFEVPLPSLPKTKSPWASSKIVIIPCFSANSDIWSNWDQSPSILNIPSVMITFLPFVLRTFRSKSSILLCLKILIFALDNLHASTILAWFNSSLNIVLSLSTIDEIVPMFAM